MSKNGTLMLGNLVLQVARVGSRFCRRTPGREFSHCELPRRPQRERLRFYVGIGT